MKWWGSHYPCWVKAFQVWLVRRRSTHTLVNNPSPMLLGSLLNALVPPKWTLVKLLLGFVSGALGEWMDIAYVYPGKELEQHACSCVHVYLEARGWDIKGLPQSVSTLCFWNWVSHWMWISSIWLSWLSNRYKRSSRLYYPAFWGYRYNASFWAWGLGI